MRSPWQVSLVLIAGCCSTGLAAEADGRSLLLQRRFAALDRDADGRLTRAEAGDATWFDRLDRDGDGAITRAELKEVAAVLTQRLAPAANEAPTRAPESIPTAVSPRVGPRILKPSDVNVGRLMPDLAFTDLAGKAGRFSDYASAKALVIAFTSTSCPITKKYAPSLARIEKEFAPRGVAFLYVNPTPTDSSGEIRTTIAENRLAGRYVHDTCLLYTSPSPRD